jgi:hypothetical protein
MNDRMKQKIRTEKVNNQTADPKANASVFLFFPTAHFLKTILANRIPKAFGSTFGFTRHPDSNRDQPFAKPKEPFFCQRTDIVTNEKLILTD